MFNPKKIKSYKYELYAFITYITSLKFKLYDFFLKFGLNICHFDLRDFSKSFLISTIIMIIMNLFLIRQRWRRIIC